MGGWSPLGCGLSSIWTDWPDYAVRIKNFLTPDFVHLLGLLPLLLTHLSAAIAWPLAENTIAWHPARSNGLRGNRCIKTRAYGWITIYLWVHLQKETIDTELKSLSIVFKSLAPSTCSFDEVKVKVPELPCMKEVDLFPTLTVIRTRSLVVQARGITPQLLSLPAVHLRYTSIGIDVRSLDFAYVDLSSRAMQYLIRTTAVTNSIATLNLTFCRHHSILAGLILPKLEVLSIDAGYGLSGIFTFVMHHQSLVCLTVDDTPSLLDIPLQPQQPFQLPLLHLFRGTTFVFEQLVSRLVAFPCLDILVLN